MLCEKTIICWSFLLSGSDPSIGYYGAIVEKCLALICNYSSISIVFIHRSNNMSVQMIATSSCLSYIEGPTLLSALDIVI